MPNYFSLYFQLLDLKMSGKKRQWTLDGRQSGKGNLPLVAALPGASGDRTGRSELARE
ncbi:hypothetical protein SA496_17705 [Pseudomonas sp. JS3066]|uniref:hypothetical protein n=1 Tax=unclassified Pseudomonas TaxID=196821 RepID=UPI0015B61C6F|nr:MULTISPECIES: hypothetical protein [unclassified Pseudomonas]WVK91551.1 hypothetical protein SA496_17705 [Pseudomonas sp. JS3066]